MTEETPAEPPVENPPVETPPEDSVLNTVKKLLNISPDYAAFDLDIMLYINSTFIILRDLGVGPNIPFSITGQMESWSSFTENNAEVDMVKTYVANKVRLIFDPPANSFTIEAIKSVIAEFEWRLNSNAEERNSV